METIQETIEIASEKHCSLIAEALGANHVALDFVVSVRSLIKGLS